MSPRIDPEVITRRGVLKRGAAVSGALVLGTATSGRVTASGGRGFVTADAIENENFDRKRFYVNQTGRSVLTTSPNCNNDNNPKRYRHWQIVEEDFAPGESNETQDALYLPANRSVGDVGDSDVLHVLHNVRSCGTGVIDRPGSDGPESVDLYSVTFKHANDR